MGGREERSPKLQVASGLVLSRSRLDRSLTWTHQLPVLALVGAQRGCKFARLRLSQANGLD
jgi:hypothetical protein